MASRPCNRRLPPAAAILLMAAGLSGCTLGPDYARPQIAAPAEWRTPPVEQVSIPDAANTAWWTQFNDPVLDQLIDEALANNLEVKVAAARIDQFIATLAVTRSQLFPQLGYGGNATRAQASRVGQPPLPPGVDATFSLFQASLGANWQLDLFGRIRRQSEAVQAQVYASEQGRRGVILTLVSNVATSYIVMRMLDRQLAIAEATAANFDKTAHIFDLRFKQGIISKTELMQITSQAQLARASIPALRQAIAAQENLLSILLGRNSAAIARGKSIDELPVPAIPADLPSSLLSRRPDILQAEQNLVAANANVGVARTLYYPNISLTGLFGSVSTAFSSLFTGPAQAWSIGAGITGPIFTFGAVKGQNNAADAVREQALLGYRQTVLNAFRETNDALTGSTQKADEVAEQQKRVAALRELARLAALRFDNGVTSYTDVLIADNELFAAEIAAVRIKAERQTQVINVYRAMGGGWVTTAAAKTQSASAGGS